MTASRMLDASGRMPECKVEDSDAIGAYRQVALADAHTLLGASPADFSRNMDLF